MNDNDRDKRDKREKGEKGEKVLTNNIQKFNLLRSFPG
jgi:hypothetical protein